MQKEKKLDNLDLVFEVIAITETWINEDNANIFSLMVIILVMGIEI